MANVSIKFNGKEFLLSCDDGQEEHLEELSLHLNKKFDNLKNQLGNIGENKLLLISSIKIMDEYFETKKNIDNKKEELKNLSNKFRELKSLVYEYKKKKEDEIKLLNESQEKIKKEIEKNKEDYEKIIEDAADKIENFVEKTNLENPIQ
jgi:cell division protein ZapA